MKLFWKMFSCRPRPKPCNRGPQGPPRKKCKKLSVLSRKWHHPFFSFFFCLVFFVVLRPFCLSGAPFLIYAVFFRPHPKPQSRGPACFCTIFCQKHWFVYIFFSGAPCFVSCSFVFALLSLFCLSGAPFLILLRPFCLSGAPFLIYTFFFRPRPKPQSRGPYVLARFFAKKTDSFTFFPRGPLVLFLVLLFLLF